MAVLERSGVQQRTIDFRPLLGRIEEGNRRLLLHMAQKMANRR